MAGKFELHKLLPSNVVPPEPEPRLVFDGRLVLTSPPKRPKQRIKHNPTWLEAFSIYCLILESYFPYRWKDLLQYQLFILRTYCQFSGRVWLSYDRAFRENATATNLIDWSQLNSTLFSFHSAGWSAHSSCDSSDGQNESPTVLLRLRSPANPGSRSLHGPFSALPFCHKCANCHGPHRAAVCLVNTPTKPSSSSKHSPDLPPPRSKQQ